MNLTFHDRSSVTEDFKARESDLIWKITYKKSPIYIYLLLEFQSTVDKSMPLRFLRYITEFYQSLYVQTESGKYPAVFPILIYNGDDRWTAPVKSQDLIEDSIPAGYIPAFQYYPIIENEIPQQSLLKIKNALSAVFYAENSSPEELRKKLDTFFGILEGENIEAVKTLVHWLNDYLYKIDQETRDPIIEKISTITEAKTMLQTKIRAYEKKLIEQGIEQEAIETAKRMLVKDFSVSDICELTGLSETVVQNLKK
ncbi:Rpn family recombination-promoting nuclease/putative transposase [Marispirochaeta sp.]|uniref:Rpn family recombination-promoting nuclease/putative transposase n=1 Tax=Marispirochaeta sp. TaxID=2038653 RepID=UPI0029C74F4E|nr:Rpn family recombination-promoting nuclease/putative transposase [Marispirochaeta sp.]